MLAKPEPTRYIVLGVHADRADDPPAERPARREARGDRLMAAARAAGRLAVVRRPAGRLRARPGRRRGRDRQRDRPERRRQDDALQPDHRHLRARTRATSCSTGGASSGCAPHKINQLGVARTFQTLRLFLNMTVKENVMAAAVRSHPGGRRSLDAAHAAACGARSGRSSALAEERLVVLRRAADGLPLEPARVPPLVREPAAARDRARDGDEPAHPPARRAGRRHEPGRDARDHRADRASSATRAATRSS